MRILSWNCLGLGDPQTVQSLYLLVKEKMPNVVFLMETKLSYVKAHSAAKKLKFDGCIVVKVVGRSGGLMLLWK